MNPQDNFESDEEEWILDLENDDAWYRYSVSAVEFRDMHMRATENDLTVSVFKDKGRRPNPDIADIVFNLTVRGMHPETRRPLRLRPPRQASEDEEILEEEVDRYLADKDKHTDLGTALPTAVQESPAPK